MPGPDLTPAQVTTLNQQVDTDIPGAIQTYEDGKVAVQDQILNLTELVSLHEAFWGWYHDDVASKYETELKWIDGHFIVEPVTDADLVDARDFKPDSRLYPAGYTKLNPKYIDQLKGITDEDPGDTLKHVEGCLHPVCYEIAKALRDGQSGSGSSVTGNVVGPGTTSITVAGSGFAPGARAVITTITGKYAVFRIDSVGGTGPYTLNGAMVAFCAANDQIGAGAGIIDTVAGQTANLAATLGLLTTALNNQKAALDSNKDDISYAGVDSDIATASAQIVTTTGVYTSYSTYAQLVTAMETRETFLSSRMSQIAMAVDTADDGIYDRRYRWLGNLVNRSQGSYTMLDGATASISFFDTNIEYLEGQQADLEEWS